VQKGSKKKARAKTPFQYAKDKTETENAPDNACRKEEKKQSQIKNNEYTQESKSSPNPC
jgi:hypothetical protein